MESFCLLDQIWTDRGASVCCCRIKIAASMEGSHDRDDSCCLLHNKWVFRRNYEKLQLIILADGIALGVAANEYAGVEPRDMYAAQLLCELKSQPGLHGKDHEIDEFSAKSGKLTHDYSPRNTAPRRTVRKTKDILRLGEKGEKNRAVTLYRKSGSICGRNELLSASIEAAERLHLPVCEYDTEEPNFPSRLTDGGVKSNLINGSIRLPIVEKSMNTTRNYLKKRKQDIPSPPTSFGASNVSVSSSKRSRKYKTLAELYK
ncbi:hypothetical protein O6H91_04G026600 [Diphasiastrum complanatum]|uniref:Uncharacterized protein n=1 Tax=Diphasiastrum complanatum TaxID=34168 RepID=A0ACC2DV60_DIPCM|nr:hypothetical protein O6H91_04G026600 [Diphasiastrum complanatum]